MTVLERALILCILACPTLLVVGQQQHSFDCSYLSSSGDHYDLTALRECVAFLFGMNVVSELL